jgi:predicted phosphodiesterase
VEGVTTTVEGGGLMRVAIISDLHANATALSAVCEHLETQQTDAVWFLGDLVGYNAEVLRCLRLLEDLNPEVWLKGNHDMAVCMLKPLGGPHRIRAKPCPEDSWRSVDDDGIRGPHSSPEMLRYWGIRLDNTREEATQFELLVPRPDVQEVLAWHALQLKKAAAPERLGRIQNALTWQVLPEIGCVVAHGAARNEYKHSWKNVGGNAYVRRNPDLDTHYLIKKSFDQAKARSEVSIRLLLVGHTHEQMVLQEVKLNWNPVKFQHNSEHREFSERVISLDEKSRYVINPGSVGQPRDHDPRAAYALWDTELSKVHLYRIPYDIALTQAVMIPFYPESYRQRLEKGE